MYKVLFYIIAFVIIMFSCSKNNKKVVPDTSYPEVNARLETVPLDEYTLYPTDLFLMSDSILVVHEPKKNKNFISIFNTDKQELIYSIGTVGESPNEFINPRILNDLNTDTSLTIGDSKKIINYNIDSLSNQGYGGNTVLVPPTEMMLYNNVLIKRDSLIVYTQTGEHPLSIFNLPTKSLTFIDYFPEVDLTEDSKYFKNKYLKNMEVFNNCMSSNGEYVAIAYHNWNILSIISLDGNIKKEIYFPEWDYNLNNLEINDYDGNPTFNKNAKIFFTKVKSNSNYIYALGWSSKKKDIKDAIASSYIYVLDWEGNIIRKISFDKSVSNFCLNNETIPYVVAMGDDGELHVYSCDVN